MKPICIVRDPDGDILLADSVDPVSNSSVWPFNQKFYRAGYAIHRGGLEFGNYNDYPVQEFILYSREGGVQKRVNEALAHARQTQRQLKEAGFYDAERKGRFNLPTN